MSKYLVDEEMRIGNYVLTGGEPVATVMATAVVRLLPGVLGNEESGLNESHAKEGLTGPEQYTRPAKYKNWLVPEVLLSGDPKKINSYKNQSRTLIED